MKHESGAPGEAAVLADTWRDPVGFIGWLSATDHKAIGRRFIVTAFGFFVAAVRSVRPDFTGVADLSLSGLEFGGRPLSVEVDAGHAQVTLGGV